jgi:hypothetical protein
MQCYILKDSDSCQIDEVPGVVKREETIADGICIHLNYIRYMNVYLIVL